MYSQYQIPHFSALLHRRPHLIARIRGSEKYPEIRGIVRFYQSNHGVIIMAEVAGLPDTAETCQAPIFGFHIHEGEHCSGNVGDPFANVGQHYNPKRCPHPYHAGDMPPLFGAGGYAFSAFLTDRVRVPELLGKTVIIHASPDDFKTQPAGGAGEKIACGVIERKK